MDNEDKRFILFLTSESSRYKNEPTVITIDISKNRSAEKTVLLIQLLKFDAENYFRIEQNPK